MDDIQKFIKKMKEENGEPREGFDDYMKKCVRVIQPSKVPDANINWALPEGIVLHDLWVQPFYDAKVFKARDTDVLTISFPKSGSAWVQEIIYLIINDADFEKANSAPIIIRSPFFDGPVGGIRGLDKIADPRLFKTHRPYDLLPPSFIENKTKIVYVARNPKDTIVSYFNFSKVVGYIQYDGTFQEMVDYFCQDQLYYGSYARNVLSYWERRNQDNILFLFFEDLKKDFKSNVRKIAQFFGKSFTEDQLDRIVDHCNFENLKKNPKNIDSESEAWIRAPDSKTDYLRKGKTGDWRNYFNDELNNKVDQYMAKHFGTSDIVFTYRI